MTRLAARRAATRAGAVVAFLAVVVGCSARPAAAQSQMSAELQQQWAKALGLYLQDPLKQRGELRRLARRYGTDGLPIPFLLALADLDLRSSRERAAGEMFDRVLAEAPGQPWAGWCEFALGAIATRQGDDDGARTHFERATDPGSPTRAMALVTLGMADARAGEVQLALSRFQAVEKVPGATDTIRLAARLGAAYTRYWNGDYDAAARAFKAIADAGAGDLTDDARYGEARSRWAAGDRDEARALFEALAGTAPGDDKPVSRALVDLRPEAVFRAGFEKYRRSPFTPGENLVTASFNGDGAALARAALRLLDPEAPPQPPMIGPAARALAPTFQGPGGGAGRGEPGAAHDGSVAPASPAAARPDAGAPVTEAPLARGKGTTLMWIVALLGAIVAGLLVRGSSRRGRAPGSSKG